MQYVFNLFRLHTGTFLNQEVRISLPQSITNSIPPSVPPSLPVSNRCPNASTGYARGRRLSTSPTSSPRPGCNCGRSIKVTDRQADRRRRDRRKGESGLQADLRPLRTCVIAVCAPAPGRYTQLQLQLQSSEDALSPPGARLMHSCARTRVGAHTRGGARTRS